MPKQSHPSKPAPAKEPKYSGVKVPDYVKEAQPKQEPKK